MLMATQKIQLPAAWTSARTRFAQLCDSCAVLRHASETPGITHTKQGGWEWEVGRDRGGQEP